MTFWKDLATSAATAAASSVVSGRKLALLDVWQSHLLQQLARDTETTPAGQTIVRLLSTASDIDKSVRIRHAWKKAWSMHGDALASAFASELNAND